MKRNFKAVLQYEGTRYQGWQKQTTTENTIQGRIESLLERMCAEPVGVNASGRTDAGVHAYGQVISFCCTTTKTPEEILTYMNTYLPEDIGVLMVKEAGPRFHARLHATGKVYRYRVLNSRIPHIFERRLVTVYPEPLKEELVREACSRFLGTHDFQAFTAKKTKKSTIRTIHEIRLERIGEEWQFTFAGDGFLYHMVRIMMGTILEIGSQKRSVESIEEAFLSKERSKAGFLAPPQGLALMEVFYH